MRLAASAKMGYYPAPAEAIQQWCQHVRWNPDKPVSLLDPCAGEGMALKAIQGELHWPSERIWAIELDTTRAGRCREALPGANVIGPASAFGVAMTAGSISLCWCNPPFDADGGTRVEAQFLDSVTRWLVPRGILAMACPQPVVDQYDVTKILLSHYDRIAVIPWPAEHRQFNEVTVLAVKRPSPVDWGFVTRQQVFVNPQAILFGNLLPYEVPTGHGPKRFEKSDLTEEEYATCMASSPVMRHFAPQAEPPPLRPPMTLSKGHLAILLASGHLDGLVEPPGELPHVVRGVVRKQQYETSKTVEATREAKTTTTVTTERMSIAVRVLSSDGTLRTFGEVDDEVTEGGNDDCD